MLFLILVQAIIASSNGQPYTITNLNSNPGIFYEYLGTINTKIGEWITYADLDLSPLEFLGYRFRDRINKIISICPPSTSNCTHFRTKTTYLLHYMNITERLYQELYNLIPEEEFEEETEFPNLPDFQQSRLNITKNNYETQLSIPHILMDGITDYTQTLAELREKIETGYSEMEYLASDLIHPTSIYFYQESEPWLNTIESCISLYSDIYRRAIDGLSLAQRKIISPLLIA